MPPPSRPILPATDAASQGATKKRVAELNWQEKLDLIYKWDAWSAKWRQFIENTEPQMSVFAKEHNIRVSYLKGLVERRESLEAITRTLSGATEKRHRLVDRPFLPVENIVKQWLRYFRDRLIPIDITILRLLANDVYNTWESAIGPLTDNKGNPPSWSEKWAHNFMVHWDIHYYKMVGEASSVDLEAIGPEVQKIMERLDRYELDDIYNCDESGLYLKWMSHWTLDYLK
ncbi:hypothetical protein BG011_002874, partial [Mortierella polycephala]